MFARTLCGAVAQMNTDIRQKAQGKRQKVKVKRKKYGQQLGLNTFSFYPFPFYLPLAYFRGHLRGRAKRSMRD